MKHKQAHQIQQHHPLSSAVQTNAAFTSSKRRAAGKNISSKTEMVVKWTLLWTTTAAVCTWSASCGHSEANNQQHYGESAPPVDGRMVSLGSIESMQIRVHTGNLAEPVKVLDLVQPDNAQSNDPAAALNRAFLAEMQSSIEVLCHDRFFLISVSRISARMLGVKQANQISFSNDSEELCSATEKRSNATHIVLHSLYTKCNTERHVYSGREEYDNELLLTSEESANIVDYKVNRKVPPDSRMLTTTVVQIRCVKLIAVEENGNENFTNMHETSATTAHWSKSDFLLLLGPSNSRVRTRRLPAACRLPLFDANWTTTATTDTPLSLSSLSVITTRQFD
ncbi:putative ABC transporter ATP-binding protein YfmR [Trichinella pseudospiralis]